MNVTETLEKEDTTENYVKYETDEADGIADFTTLYIPIEEFDEADEAPEAVEVDVTEA